MNKWLIGWNIVLTILLLAVVISGCSSMDPQFTALQTEVRNNRDAINGLAEATKILALATQEMANTLQAQIDWNENRINQVGENLNEQNNELDKLLMILKIAGILL